MTVGDKIYTLRTQAGFSQEEFAEMVGVSRQSISKWETSVAMPDTEYIIKICKLLDISTDQLLINEDLPVPNYVKQQKERDTQFDNVRKQLNNMSLTGFIFSFVFSIIGLIISCVAVKRTAKLLGNSTLFSVAGIAISAAKLFGELILLYAWIVSSLAFRGII